MNIWRRAFCRLYETDTPTVPLNQILHWHAVAAALDRHTVADAELAYVPDGYFYRPHTPAPTVAEQTVHRTEAAAAGAQWLLYPVVRPEEAGSLDHSDFTVLPWFLEAEFVVDGALEAELRALLGGARLRELNRLTRRAQEQYTWEAVEPDRDTLQAFDRLHRLNLMKYRHSRNHFTPAILDAVVRSTLREQIRIFLHRRRTDGTAVQAILGIQHRATRTVELLVGGIDHTQVPASQNLYAVALHRIYRWGAAEGAHRFNLGRGSALTKLAVGANRFHVVANHISPLSTPHPHAFTPLRTAARDRLAAELAALTKAADRRHGGGKVILPKEIA